jgi:hypothetical protein
MHRLIQAIPLALAFVMATAVPVRAEDVKMVGVLTKLEVAKDGKSAVATLKDNESAKLVPIAVQDDVTLRKFERNLISVGDEIKVKYEVKGKKKVAKSFLRAAGCSG